MAQEGDQAGEDGAQGAVQHGLRHHEQFWPLPPRLISLPDVRQCEHHPRMIGGHCAKDGGDQHKDRQISRRPLLVLRQPSEDDELADLLVHQAQQPIRHERADRGPHEGAERELDGPCGRRDLFEHVEEPADRRVEQHRHRASPTHGAIDARGLGEALLVDDDHRHLVRQVDPLPHERHRHPLADEVGEVPADCHRGPLAAHGEAGRVRQDARHDPHDERPGGEQARHLAPVEVALVLWQARAATRGRQDHDHRGPDERIPAGDTRQDDDAHAHTEAVDHPLHQPKFRRDRLLDREHGDKVDQCHGDRCEKRGPPHDDLGQPVRAWLCSDPPGQPLGLAQQELGKGARIAASARLADPQHEPGRVHCRPR
mmetsp:Transcript_5853/g.16984  ORF Transcript_5853/g.16984 Transcript_5853/m.16984 type:complete len:370 (-) Transcript_5853:19-1128(-)